MNHNNGYLLKGESDHIKDVKRQIGAVARYDTPVLIYGETGTGKEIVANQIHARSRRSDMLFVPLNCSAIPSGLVETELFGHERGAFTGSVENYPGAFLLANGGTLFLDEVGAMLPDAQPKLLRVLESGKFRQVGGRKEKNVDVRVISATNDPGIYDPKHFRKDLYYRLCVYAINLMPLRERREDIRAIAHNFIETWMERNEVNRTLHPDAVSLMMSYDWPGNVRELQTVLERACIEAEEGILSSEIVREKIGQSGNNRRTDTGHGKIDHYPDGFTTSTKFPWNMDDARNYFTEEYLKTALMRTGRVTEAARMLGISLRSFRYWARKCGFRPIEYFQGLDKDAGKK